MSARRADMQPQVRSFNDHAPPGVRHLVRTSVLLGVAEVEVFRLAYGYWYDRKMDDKLLDDLVGVYLTRRETPEWVGGFCKRVLHRADAGELDPGEFGVRQVRRRPVDRQFASYATLAAFVVFWLLFA